MFQLITSPYSLSTETETEIAEELGQIEERVALLRRIGTLSNQTVLDYYGQKRFEQVAESNALEGSTLSVGETELAVMKGITITGHDPAYVRDAIALDRALSRVVEISRIPNRPTDIEQLLEIHQLLLGDRPGAGVFRKEPVRIKGAAHTPPRGWSEIMTGMEVWERWSQANASAPAPFRAAVLHAWLTHVHPFIDGNGRVARAIGNLELIRAGYPPIIIKKKERDQYIEALAESDAGGDLRSFLNLIFGRTTAAITGLETAAKKLEGYNPAVERLRKQQEQQLAIWSTGVKLLGTIIEHNLTRHLEPMRGRVLCRIFENYLDTDDYVSLCAGDSISGGWSFIVNIEVPGIGRLEKLAYVQHRSSRLYQHLGQQGGPSLFWSHVNPNGYPKWARDLENSPYAIEVTTRQGSGDEWIALLANGTIVECNTTELATRFADALIAQV
ncbi:Fic family protein [Sphingomonas melonis]|uniref:Fic family protein n=1 Tax=Sphingomonas melonis TaxID=152682 RepID=A0A7Y9FQ25_9SPHN|nr:Fic family protein [Sphingomonas melonis]NYD91373.1 Fic family protein [Sphingomonas melonis]